jgi:hypothetical protein
MSHDEWNQDLTIANYDQAWSMVQFLAHGDGGKYQTAFDGFMISLSRNQSWQQAWQDNFGGTDGFEQCWKQYWLQLPPDPTATLFAQATTATFTSFLARATASHQRFDDFEGFLATASRRALHISDDDWLPPALLESAVARAARQRGQGVSWFLAAPDSDAPALVCVLPDGDRLIGTFVLRDGLVSQVTVQAKGK